MTLKGGYFLKRTVIGMGGNRERRAKSCIVVVERCPYRNETTRSVVDSAAHPWLCPSHSLTFFPPCNHPLPSSLSTPSILSTHYPDLPFSSFSSISALLPSISNYPDHRLFHSSDQIFSTPCTSTPSSRPHHTHPSTSDISFTARVVFSFSHPIHLLAVLKKICNMSSRPKQSMSELKLRRLLEHNQRLREDLGRPRIRVSEASASLIRYCKTTTDHLVSPLSVFSPLTLPLSLLLLPHRLPSPTPITSRLPLTWPANPILSPFSRFHANVVSSRSHPCGAL